MEITGTNSTMKEENQKYIFSMSSKSARLATFKNWPFDSTCKCVPEKMAEAGFYHCPTSNDPDLVQCFMCLKELDGWEPADDPWKEHKSHSKDCPFLKSVPEDEMTVADFMKMEMKRQKWQVKRAQEKIEREFRNYAQEARYAMESLGDI